MNDIDPFSGQVLNVSGGNGEAVSITIRAGNASDPVVIFKAADNAEAADLLGAAEATGLFALIANAATALKGHFNVGQALGATPVTSPATAQQAYQAQGAPQYQAPTQQGYQAPPQAAQGPPPGLPAPQCPHGVKNYVAAGVSKSTGKAYSAFWGCPAPQAEPSKCRPEWVK